MSLALLITRNIIWENLSKKGTILSEAQTSFNCLSPRHMVEDCKSTVRCEVTNCGKRHHSSLHCSNQGSASTSTKRGHSNHKITPIQIITTSDTKFAKNKASQFESKTAFNTSTRFKKLVKFKLFPYASKAGKVLWTATTYSTPVVLHLMY